ncbi:MAG: M28 family peptidase [Gemmatimonadetes bacterium]|nr:M28 family peptidase [Gemmatimonadota bacterium]
MKTGVLVAVLVIGLGGTAAAQRPDVAKAAASITEADVRARVHAIAHDSMGGRDTPSPGLEKAALWVASEFRRLGLKPAGDEGSFIQRYPVTVTRPDPDSAFLAFSNPEGRSFKLQIGRDARVEGMAPATLTTIGMVLIGGATIDTAAIPRDAVAGKMAVLVMDWSKGMTEQLQAAIGVVMSRGARAVVMPVNSDSMAGVMGLGEEPAPRVARGTAPRTSRGGAFFPLVSERAIVAALPEAAERFAALRASPTTTVVPSEWQASVIDKPGPAKTEMVPNTVGILEGTDPLLKNEYLVVSAHMDHVGSACSGGTPEDQICNGADDDASGTVGVVELAEAFVLARPKRSVIFLTVSGEEKGLWGSSHFAERPPVEIKQIVANLNMDMVGRNWRDTIVAIGKEHSDLGQTADRVAAANPDLNMKVIDDLWPQENLYFRSDHYNFARKGIPILFFTSGLHGDYHAVTDSPDKIDAEKEARILKLVFHLGQEIGNAPNRPKWNPESYKKIVSPQAQVP